MWILASGLLILAIVAFVLGYIRNKKFQKKIEKGELDDFPEIHQTDTECCGQHEMCEHDSLLAAVSRKIEYYDDEELDEYKGISGNEYTSEQAEQFREILYTMKDEEVAGWSRSLQLRGINLPDELKDELYLVIGERRTQA